MRTELHLHKLYTVHTATPRTDTQCHEICVPKSFFSETIKIGQIVLIKSKFSRKFLPIITLANNVVY